LGVGFGFWGDVVLIFSLDGDFAANFEDAFRGLGLLIDNAAVVLFFEAPLEDILAPRVFKLVAEQAKLPARIRRLFFCNRRF
jgi:hypothetical protein